MCQFQDPPPTPNIHPPSSAHGLTILTPPLSWNSWLRRGGNWDVPIYGLAVVRISPMKQFRAVEAPLPSLPRTLPQAVSTVGRTWRRRRRWHLAASVAAAPPPPLHPPEGLWPYHAWLARVGTRSRSHSGALWESRGRGACALWLRMGELPGPAGSSFMLMLRLPLWELPPKPAAHWNGKGGSGPFEWQKEEDYVCSCCLIIIIVVIIIIIIQNLTLMSNWRSHWIMGGQSA